MFSKISEIEEIKCNFIQNPTVTDGGIYRCNITNADGEVNANLNLNFEQEKPKTPPPVEMVEETREERREEHSEEKMETNVESRKTEASTVVENAYVS